jgi:hypothetical protein
MTPRLRKFALTAHITGSVGWLGATVSYLILAIVGMTSRDLPTVRAAYLVMEKTVWFVILPFNFTSLLSGLVVALGTTWGLFRHYWVVTKLVLNLITTAVLLGYTAEIRHFSRIAAKPTLSSADLQSLRDPDSVLHAGAAVLVLLAATVLAVYKPWGMTRRWRRKQYERRKQRQSPDRRAVPAS